MMAHDHLSSTAPKPTMLCVRSRANDPVLDEVLRCFRPIVVHDARLAVRKGSLGSYDVFLAYDARADRAPLHFWESIRRVDPNTPFVMVFRAPVAEVAERLRPGFDAALQYPCDPRALLDATRRLLAASARRNVEAERQAVDAVCQDLGRRLALLEERLHISRQLLARGQEHVVRAPAMRLFFGRGGTRSYFEQAWPGVFEAAMVECRAAADGLGMTRR